MGKFKFEQAKKQLGNKIKYCKEYFDLKENLFIKIKNNGDYDKIKTDLLKLKIVKEEVLKEITDILYEKGLEVNLLSQEDSVEKGLGMLASFTLDDMYYNSSELPNLINEKLKDEFYDDCFEAYLVLFDLVKKNKISKEKIYENLFNLFSYKYDIIIDIYKENGIEACIKYLKILNLFKKDFKTTVIGVFNDERYRNYILFLTGKNNVLNSLTTNDLYLILLNFNNDEFLNKVVETNGQVLIDIASVILRRKKDGLTYEDEKNQLRILANNVNVIPKKDESIIKL